MGEQWETFDDIKAVGTAAGFEITRDKLQRWRGHGLLPPVQQVGRGRPTGGSDTRHPHGTATQAIEIERLLRTRKKLAGVGWALWMQGFAVDEKHWSVPLESARAAIIDFRANILRMEREDEAVEENEQSADTIYDRLDIGALAGTAIYAAVKRVPPPLRATIAAVAVGVMTGNFKFPRTDHDSSASNVIDAFFSVLGLTEIASSLVINLPGTTALEAILENISLSLQLSDQPNCGISEPPEFVRREFADAIAIASELYTATGWIFNGRVNLKTISDINSNSGASVQAMMLLVWSRYRETAPDIEQTSVIAGMAEGARLAHLLAGRLLTEMSCWPANHPFATPAKFRRALSSPASYLSAINSLRKFNELTTKSRDALDDSCRLAGCETSPI